MEDGFRRTLVKLTAENQGLAEDPVLSVKLGTLYHCGKCKNVAGEIENEHIYLMQVLEPTDDDEGAFSVKNLLQ